MIDEDEAKRVGLPSQEFLHDPDAGTVGDCWRACLAGITGTPLADVPHFARDYPEPTLEWWSASVAWAETAAPLATLVLAPTLEFPAPADGARPLVIVTGHSPRGDYLHAVIADADTGDLVWDPHPSRDFLAGPVEQVFTIVWKDDQ